MLHPSKAIYSKMYRNLAISVLFVLTLFYVMPIAIADETDRSAGSKASSVATTTINAIERGFRKAGEAIELGVNKADEAITHAAKKTGEGIEYGAKKTDQAVRRTVKKVGLDSGSESPEN